MNSKDAKKLKKLYRGHVTALAQTDFEELKRVLRRSKLKMNIAMILCVVVICFAILVELYRYGK
jgi:hypothetical protein